MTSEAAPLSTGNKARHDSLPTPSVGVVGVDIQLRDEIITVQQKLIKLGCRRKADVITCVGAEMSTKGNTSRVSSLPRTFVLHARGW